jgi:hypothetical protein
LTYVDIKFSQKTTNYINAQNLVFAVLLKLFERIELKSATAETETNSYDKELKGTINA